MLLHPVLRTWQWIQFNGGWSHVRQSKYSVIQSSDEGKTVLWARGPSPSHTWVIRGRFPRGGKATLRFKEQVVTSQVNEVGGKGEARGHLVAEPCRHRCSVFTGKGEKSSGSCQDIGARHMIHLIYFLISQCLYILSSMLCQGFSGLLFYRKRPTVGSYLL